MSSNLNLSGSIEFSTESHTTNVDVGNNSIVFIDSSSDNLSVSLPYAGNVSGRIIYVKKTVTDNNVWVEGGGNLIDGESRVLLPSSSSLPSIKLISDGSNWNILDRLAIETVVAAENLVGWWKHPEPSAPTQAVKKTTETFKVPPTFRPM